MRDWSVTYSNWARGRIGGWVKGGGGGFGGGGISGLGPLRLNIKNPQQPITPRGITIDLLNDSDERQPPAQRHTDRPLEHELYKFNSSLASRFRIFFW